MGEFILDNNRAINFVKHSVITAVNEKVSFSFKLLLVFVLAYSAMYVCAQTAFRIYYELRGPYTWDTPIYFAVGRGLLNGLKPYTDLFETKPPGIFFLSAFSLLVSGGFFLCNILQSIVLGITAFIPVLYSVNKVKTVKKSLHKTDITLVFLISLSFGMLLSLYSAKRSGEIQVESFGAAFSCIYVYIISTMNFTNISWSFFMSRSLILSSVFLLLSYGMKEPFFLVCFACALVFSKDIKQLVVKFIFPAIYSGIIGILVLLITKTLLPFINFYLPYMMSSHINRLGSPWRRAFQFNKVFDNLNLFSPYLGFLVVFIILIFVFRTFDENRIYKSSYKVFLKVFYHLLRLSLAIYLASAAVGMGGEYFNHHFVFALPVYMALFLYLLEYICHDKINIKKYILLIPLIFLICSSIVSIEETNYNNSLNYLTNSDKGNKEEAKYIDSVLDRMKIDRYLFIGSNGPQLYSYTKHSPDGPFFFQLGPWMDGANTKFRELFMEQVKRARIIVLDKYDIGNLKYEVQDYLRENFITVPWKEISDIPRNNSKYLIYYAKRNIGCGGAGGW
jgi:hypothetical protein